MASSVALREAQEHLSELLDRAENGELIVIERQGRPAMKLVPMGYEAGVARRGGGQNLLNSARGEIWLADDWDSAETNKEIEDLFNDSILFPEPPTQ